MSSSFVRVIALVIVTSLAVVTLYGVGQILTRQEVQKAQEVQGIKESERVLETTEELEVSATSEVPIASGNTSIPAHIPVGMSFPPIDHICDYPVVKFSRNNLMSPSGRFRPRVLDRARSCGTKVVVRLHGVTADIVNDSGVGLNIEKYRDRIDDFVPYLGPYITDGTILAHFTIDEPHDCHDWGGNCLTPAEVDEASRISKELWPGMATMVNTMPTFASRMVWQYTDIINFQYAYHKGDLQTFVDGGVDVLTSGKARQISWSIQASRGGCERFDECPMTSAQVETVGTTMCRSGVGEFVSILGWDAGGLTADQSAALAAIRAACGGW